jgi:Domain of Unknown Function (DUF1053)
LCVRQNKVTEKFKRPFKKRHSSVYHQPTNRVNKFLSQAIEARSVDREKSVHVNRFSLSFREREKEQQYREDFDLGFTTAMGCSLLLLILSAGLQVSQSIAISRKTSRFHPISHWKRSVVEYKGSKVETVHQQFTTKNSP